MALKIAILGTRGIPNNYGGFEHIAGYLAKGLVEKGHGVSVYSSSRHPYKNKEWNGVRIIHCFDPEHVMGMAGQFVYDLNCILDARERQFDIILMLGYTSSSVWAAVYPRNAIIINNMDGLEWKRSKYSRPVRAFLKYAERLAVKASDFRLADSPVIKRYLDEKYGGDCKYIAYGAELQPARIETVLEKYGLQKKQYYLVMARMEPENNIELILEGYELSGSDKKFVVIGNTKNRFGKKLMKKFSHNLSVIFAGAIFDERETQSLTAFCSVYFHGHSVGGTNPSLLDAMGAKVPIAAHRNHFNNAVLGKNARYFSNALEISAIMKSKAPGNIALDKNYETASKDFNWNTIIDQYERYFLQCYVQTHLHPEVYLVKEIQTSDCVH